MHRDVKPANVLLTNFEHGMWRILVVDFGIARRLDNISGLTATNTTVGTVAYAPPEQLMGSDIDGRADQYALAATAFHLLTGSPPYQRSNPIAVIGQHLTAAPPKLSNRVLSWQGSTEHCPLPFPRTPQQRFGRCREFANALNEQLTGGSISNRETEADITLASRTAGSLSRQRLPVSTVT